MHGLTPLQNFRRLADGGSPDWIPFSVDVGALSGLRAPVAQLFHQKTGQDDPAEYFRADVRCFSLPVRFGGEAPEALHASVEPGTTFDEWGVGHTPRGWPWPPLLPA